MRAKDVLLTALQEFSGTLGVSFPTTAISSTNSPTRIFRSGRRPRHGFPGNYEDYLWRKSGGADAIGAADSQAVAGRPAL